MDERRCWKYCVVGNIVKTHIDAEGILRCGSPQYTGGTKVYLSGRHWDRTLPRICVLGLNRCRKYQVNDIPVELIENVRCGRTFKPSVLSAGGMTPMKTEKQSENLRRCGTRRQKNCKRSIKEASMRYLTKEWYIACQTDPMTPEVQKRLDEIDRAYCAAQTREALPDGLLRRFFFHDGAVREIVTGTDLTLRIDSPFSEYHTVTFRNANVKQEPPRVGAVWLYRELYRHKSGRGYEAHILFEAPAGPVYRKICAAALIDTRIICDEIEFA